MPPETYTCQICGDQVSKRQSYAWKEGRACKSHEAAEQGAVSRQQKAMDKANQKGEQSQKSEHRLADPDRFRPKCGCCGKSGIPHAEFTSRMLVAQEKLAILGESQLPWKSEDGKIVPNLEYPKLMRQHMLLPGEEPQDHIYRCLVGCNNDTLRNVKHKISKIARTALSVFGGINICLECMDKLGIKPHTKPLTSAQMENWMLLGILMKDQFAEQARQELERDEALKTTANN